MKKQTSPGYHLDVRVTDGMAGLATLRDVALVLTDLPSGKTRAPCDKPVALDTFWASAKLALRKDGNVVIFASDLAFACDLMGSNIKWFRLRVGLAQGARIRIFEREASTTAGSRVHTRILATTGNVQRAEDKRPPTYPHCRAAIGRRQLRCYHRRYAVASRFNRASTSFGYQDCLRGDECGNTHPPTTETARLSCAGWCAHTLATASWWSTHALDLVLWVLRHWPRVVDSSDSRLIGRWGCKREATGAT